MTEHTGMGLTGIAALEAEMRDRLAAKDAELEKARNQLVRKNAALQTVATFIKDDPIGAAVVDVKSMQCLETFIRAAITDD